MRKKSLIKKLNKDISGNLLDIIAILEALLDLQIAPYPANTLIDIAKLKAKRTFYKIEKNRKILNILD